MPTPSYKPLCPEQQGRPWRAVLAAFMLNLGLLAACGGGGTASTVATVQPTPASSGSGSGTATVLSDTYSQGAISGFGSIVVGGVRFDDSGATVSDEDGNSSSRSALKLGMTVQVDAGAVTRNSAGNSAVARRIRFGSEIVGPVGSIDAATSSLRVLGQTVTVTSATVFDSSLVGGFAALATGAVIEVHGIRDTTTGNTVATRIEPEAAATRYRLRGTVSGLDTTAKTFKIGTETVNYASAAPAPTNLADGQTVRVLLQTTPTAGAWVATAVSNGARLPEGTVREARIEGVITAYTSSTAFTVNGLLVDASSASFPDGTTGVVLGARVEVEGSVTNGKLVATKVEIEERRDAGRRGMELHGAITSIDTAAKTFVLRGITVWYGGTVTYKGITEADLAVGKTVEVKGTLASDRTRLQASKIELESASTSTSTTG
jgi:hypothetical protein